MIVFSASPRADGPISIRKHPRVRISVRVKRPILEGFERLLEINDRARLLRRERWGSGRVLSSRT
jgi:hypothetical protein